MWYICRPLSVPFLFRLVYMGKSVLYFKMIQRTKCLIESTSIGRITDQQSQSRVIPDRTDISEVIDNVGRKGNQSSEPFTFFWVITPDMVPDIYP